MHRSKLVDYYRSELGQGVKSIICKELLSIMDLTDGDSIMGLGFATSFLEDIIAHCSTPLGRILNLIDMDVAGFESYNVSDNYFSFFSDPEVVPLPDCSVDKVIIIHGISQKNLLPNVVRSSWRVLKDDGQLIVVFVNKNSPLHVLSSRMLPEDVAFGAGEVKSILNELMFRNIKTQFLLKKCSKSMEMNKLLMSLFNITNKTMKTHLSGFVAVYGNKTMFATTKLENNKSLIKRFCPQNN